MKKNLGMDESLDLVAKKISVLAMSVKSIINEIAVSSIFCHREELANKGSKVNNIVEKIC